MGHPLGDSSEVERRAGTRPEAMGFLLSSRRVELDWWKPEDCILQSQNPLSFVGAPDLPPADRLSIISGLSA